MDNDPITATVAVSIVSHGHGEMVAALVDQLRRCPQVGRIVVTCNIPETVELAADEMVRVRTNSALRGFGANHNHAFRGCDMPFFCVLNPDIELVGNPFPDLLNLMNAEVSTIVAPRIVAPTGEAEDSARRFPTVWSLLVKALGGPDGRYHVEPCQAPVPVDWVAGMFMLFRSADFADLGGFDERYFLYYEDVDLCARAWLRGMKVMICPAVVAIHRARRQSRRNPRYLRWHVASMARFLLSRRVPR